MDTNLARGLTLTLSWTGGSGARKVRLSLGALLRVLAVLALCALSYRAGGWRQKLEQGAQAGQGGARGPVASAEVRAVAPSAAGAVSSIAAAAPGQPMGQSQDVITPLNVRDPSALVMGPSYSLPQAPAMAPPLPPQQQSAPSRPRARLIPEPNEHSGPELRM
jgi:hypothetical protein